jgi:hypothetical protein
MLLLQFDAAAATSVEHRLITQKTNRFAVSKALTTFEPGQANHVSTIFQTSQRSVAHLQDGLLRQLRPRHLPCGSRHTAQQCGGRLPAAGRQDARARLADDHRRGRVPPAGRAREQVREEPDPALVLPAPGVPADGRCTDDGGRHHCVLLLQRAAAGGVPCAGERAFT